MNEWLIFWKKRGELGKVLKSRVLLSWVLKNVLRDIFCKENSMCESIWYDNVWGIISGDYY